MATRMYLHDAAYDTSGGTYPAGEQSSGTATQTAAGANTLRQMNTTIGTAQTSVGLASTAQTAAQRSFYRMFASPKLSGAQTVGGGGNSLLNTADAESNVAMNHWIDSAVAYVWRPSTGAVVGFLIDTVSAAGTEPTAANNEQVSHIAGATTGVSAADGDVVIVEIWAEFAQGMATSYTGTVYYDGTTENVTENAAVSNHASFFEVPQNLVFQAAGTTVSPGQVTHTYTAQTPQVRARVQPAQVTHTYTGQTPKFVHTLRPAQVTHTYTSQIPQARVRVQPAQVIHTYSPQTPKVSVRVQPTQVTHIYNPLAPSVTTVSGVAVPVLTHSYVPHVPQVRARVQSAQVIHTYSPQMPQVRAQMKPSQITHTYNPQTPKVSVQLQPAQVTHSYNPQMSKLIHTVRFAQVTHAYIGRTTTFGTSLRPGLMTHVYSSQNAQLKVSIGPSLVAHVYLGRIPNLLAITVEPSLARMYIVIAQNRISQMEAQGRSLLLEAQDRILEMEAQNREGGV